MPPKTKRMHLPDAPQRNEHSRGRPVASWREHHGWSAAPACAVSLRVRSAAC
jgi:hypothetical protein